VRAEAVTYATQLGARVPAILYLPDPLPAGGGKIPAFIIVNGHGGDKYAWYAFYSGIAYARAGMAGAAATANPAHANTIASRATRRSRAASPV
jgi:dipeptidyl aminopeptidase/acylaminoacyl peptidase